MKPNDLIGEVFSIPVFHAMSQQYMVKEVEENNKMPGHWTIRLEWIPSSYSVPHELIIQIERAVNQKRMFTLIEITNDTNNKYALSKNLVKDEECSTMEKLRKVFEKLGTF